jgi:hypothetical protein
MNKILVLQRCEYFLGMNVLLLLERKYKEDFYVSNIDSCGPVLDKNTE